VGLTATPKDEVDKNTYGIFELPDGMPTYGYELDQAVADGYLVDYRTLETGLKFLEEGITYDELSPEEQAVFEETFGDPDDDSSTAPIEELVRSVVGLSQDEANTVFSAFLNTGLLEDSRQQHFVKLLVDYIVKCGMMKDFGSA
jgi:type I restriction enzyme R subunit